jgi:hypothetical protein
MLAEAEGGGCPQNHLMTGDAWRQRGWGEERWTGESWMEGAGGRVMVVLPAVRLWRDDLVE